MTNLTEGGDKELISMSFWIGLVSERFMLMGCDLGTLLLTTVLLGVCGSSFLSV